MADSLIVKLGADTSEFKGGIHEAAEATREMGGALDEVGHALDHFNENTNRIQHHLLNNFLGFEAINHIREWASEAIKGAQETREQFEKLGKPIDDATRSLAGFGDNLASIKKGTAELTGSFLSLFTRAGEGWGMLINRLKGVSAEQEKVAEGAARGAAEQEKKLAEATKAHADDGKKAAEIETKIDEDKYKRGLALLSQADQIAEITKKRTELEEQLASITGKSDADRLRSAQKKLEIDQLTDQIDAKQAQHTKENAQAEAEFLKEQASLDEKLKKAKFDLLKPADQLLDLQKQLLAVTVNVNNAQRDQETHKKDLIEQATLEKDIAEKKLAIEKATTEELKKQNKEKTQGGLIAGIGGGAQFNNASDATLEQISRTNRDKAAELSYAAKTTSYVGSDNVGYNLEAARLVAEAQNAEKELATRQQYRTLLGLPGGEDIARNSFTGNPLQFDAFISQIQNTAGKQTDKNSEKIVSGIDELNNRLRSAGFGINGG